MNDFLQPLKDLRVTCTGLGVAPLTTARMLAEQGAHVTLVASESFLWTHAVTLREFHPGFEQRPVNPGYPSGSAALKKMRAGADVWIDESGVPESAAMFAAADASGGPAGQVRCTFSAFPFAMPDLPLRELETAVSKRACLYEPITGLGRRRPFPFPVASLTAGMYGAVGIASALLNDKAGNSGRHISVALYDAALSLHSLRLIMLSEARSRWDALRWLSSPFMSLWKTGEGGWIYLHVGLTKHVALFLRLLEADGFTREAGALRRLLTPGARKDPVSLDSPMQALKMTRILRALFLKRSAEEWEKRFRSHKLCCVKVRSEAEWREYMKSADFQKTAMPAASIRLTALPKQEETAPGTRRFGESPPGLSETPVFDFTQVIAGPLAGRTLMELGAPVLRVRNPHFDQAFTEPFAASFHSGKENITIDLTKLCDRAMLDDLFRSRKPEVILHHFEPANIDPDCVFVKILAYPEQSAWASTLGFEQNIQAMAGLMKAYGSEDRPELFPVAVYDTLTGLLAAFGACLGLYARPRFQSGIKATCSLLDSARIVSEGTRLQAAFTGVRTARAEAGFGFFRIRRLLKRELTRPGSPVKTLQVPEIGKVYIPASPLRFQGVPSTLKATPLPDTAIPRKTPSRISRLIWLGYFILKKMILK